MQVVREHSIKPRNGTGVKKVGKHCSKAYIENLLDLLLVHYSRVSYFFRLVRIECN